MNFDMVIGEILYRYKYHSAHTLFLNLDNKLIELGVNDLEKTKNVFISLLAFFVKHEFGEIIFRDFTNEYKKLNLLDLDSQLKYIYNSFPTEYNESIPEKDIENLWWYFSCPFDISWKKDDGSYFVAD